MKRNDAIKLFLDKEGKELRGKHNFNFLVLVAIFAVAIVSIGFGSASMRYLRHKMEDPFINWVDIIARQRVADKMSKMPLEQFLGDTVMQKQLQFSAPEENYVLNIDFRHQKKGKNIQLQGRSIAPESSIMTKILDRSNVVEKRQLRYSDKELGLVITQGALHDLGYDEAPAFIWLALPYDVASCRELGITGEVNGNYPVAFPVVAIVKQLPGMYSFLFTNRFLHDCSAKSATSWDITDEANNQTLCLVGKQEAIRQLQQTVQAEGYSTRIDPYVLTWQEGMSKLTVENASYTDEPMAAYNALAEKCISGNPEIYRVYDFQPILDYQTDRPSYYSVQVQNLENIRLFQSELYDKCGIKLEMSSIDQKDNFQFVQRMGNILSVCIILIAVLFICFFIYFMLSTHFQRIQRNLGTFKAFGISNATLYYIYIVLLLRITIAAFAVAFAFTLLINLLLNCITAIEEGYYWIEVFVWQNALLIGLALLASVVASFWVAKTKLKHTPGDLIYNRNQN